MPADRVRVPDAVTRTKIVAIARGVDPERLLEAAEVPRAAGIPGIEVTLDSPGALSVIPRLRDTYGDAVSVGAGTVMNVQEGKAGRASGDPVADSLRAHGWDRRGQRPRVPGRRRHDFLDPGA